MKKWYICTLFIAFALLSFVSKEQATLPNQKIVLQFSNTTITSTEIENTLTIVKKQLVDFGVENIQIHKIKNGKLKITYYSDLDVVSIKSKLLKEDKFAINLAAKNKEKHPEIPLQKDTTSYNLDVFKIKEASNSTSGFNGKVALEPKIESDRFFNPTINFSAYFLEEQAVSINQLFTNKTQTNIAIAIDNTSYKIPEVRAGPNTNKTS